MASVRPQLCLSIVSVILVVVATALSSSLNKSLALYVLLPTICVFSAMSACLEWGIHRSGSSDNNDNKKARLILVENGLRPTAASSLLVIAPSISLCILLFVRILFMDHFLTDPAALDFGPKYGISDGEPNISFGPEFNSFGHWIQGVVATLFAFPAAGGLLARCCRRDKNQSQLVLASPRAWLLVMSQCASFAFTVYPAYNFVKRTLRSADAFATSSYMNNGCEWAMGALVGISLGMLLSSIAKAKLMSALKENNQVSDGSNDIDKYPFALVEEYTSNRSRCLVRLCLGVSRLLGVFFLVSVFGAAASTGLTWNNCQDGAADCVNYNHDQPPIGVVIGLTLIPSVTCGLTVCMAFKGST